VRIDDRAVAFVSHVGLAIQGAHLRFHILTHLLELRFWTKRSPRNLGLGPEKSEDEKPDNSNACDREKRKGRRKDEHENPANSRHREEGRAGYR